MNPQNMAHWSRRHRIVHGLLWRLGRVGVRVSLLVGIREGAREIEPVRPDGDLRFAELTLSDAPAFAGLGDPEDDPGVASERFGRGNLCFGLWDGDRLVAKTWCDVSEVTYPHFRRALQPGEVYLLAAYSDPACRGRGLAPLLRAACYSELRRRGYSRFYSLSEYLNLPARRFKQKLGAVEEELRVHCDFFGRGSTAFALKRWW